MKREGWGRGQEKRNSGGRGGERDREAENVNANYISISLSGERLTSTMSTAHTQTHTTLHGEQSVLKLQLSTVKV